MLMLARVERCRPYSPMRSLALHGGLLESDIMAVRWSDGHASPGQP
jgi:hypothetical protein